MGLLNSLDNTTSPLMFDASVVINLIASGFAAEIVNALPLRVSVVGSVIAEVEAGRVRGRQDECVLTQLISAGLIEQTELCDAGEELFAGLVTGSAAETLDDGEAATIACAIQQGAVAVIDEKKASRICAERFPALEVACTTDLFMHSRVAAEFPREQLVQCVINALRLARMRVRPAHVSWVIDLIGHKEASKCLSLPQSVREVRART